MADLTENIADLAEAFDDLRAEFFSENSTCYLLAGDGITEPFTVKRQLAGGWFLEYTKYRGWSELWCATNDADFAKALSLSGYYAVNGDVYDISEGDTVPPQGDEPYWRVGGKHIGGKKFVAPVVP